MHEKVLNIISGLYKNNLTITVVNNIKGKSFRNNRGSLRQGDLPSMTWFSYKIEPLFLYLDRRLAGIPICSLTTLGPAEEDGTKPEPLVEKYRIIGYADDVKQSVTTMSEFLLVDKAASLFERSSGCRLH